MKEAWESRKPIPYITAWEKRFKVFKQDCSNWHWVGSLDFFTPEKPNDEVIEYLEQSMWQDIGNRLSS